MQLRQGIFVGILVGLLAAALPAAGQIVKVDPPSLNFGEMKPREQRQGSITITNAGGGRLHLRRAEADCGCTTMNFQPVFLGPGQSTVLEIKFDSKNFSGRTIKMVHIETNDPLHPIVDVAVQAMVRNPLVMDPPSRRIKFGTSLVGRKEMIGKTFTAMDAAALELRTEGTRSGLFEVAIENNYEGHAHKSRLTVTRPAELRPGDHRDQVRIYTNLDEPTFVDLDIAARLSLAIQAKPAVINYRFKKEFKNRVRVAPFPGQKVQYKVTGAECDLPGLEYEVIETIPNKETLVMLSGAPVPKDDPRALANGGKMKGTLRIFTDLPEAPVLEVELSYMIRM